MDAFAGKHERNENESNSKENHQGLLIETIEQNEALPITTSYNLPLEMLDMILQKSYLHWILNSSTNQSDEEVIRSLISVDVCFYRRITRHRFKKAIWNYLKDFYEKTKKRYAIIRDNRNFLLENIQPNDELIASLLSHNCMTEEQRNFIQRQGSNRKKNDEILSAVTSFDDRKVSKFAKCLRQTSRKTVARIIEDGGAVIKMQVQTRGAKCSTSMELQLLKKQIEELRNKTKPWSHKTVKLISQLSEEDIEILNSQLDRQTVIVWIWCRSQAALEHIQSLYESNQLRDVFFENIQPYISVVINIDWNQFKETIVVCSISIKFTQRIKLREYDDFYAVTKLRNKIYILCRSYSTDKYVYSSPQSVIRVYQDLKPFRLDKEIELTVCDSPFDIASSEKGNCLYVSDYKDKCVWKITRETDDQQKVVKWLTTDYHPTTLSVPSDGKLLMVNDFSSILNIYGSDAELLRSIQLPKDIEMPRHAVETSIGNFIIIHRWMARKDEGESGSSWRQGERVTKWDICELTRDGQNLMVIRRFSPSNETQELNDPFYLSLDSDDRVFVADYGNDRVIFLYSDLEWNRILCPTKEREEWRILKSWRLCYDEEKEQLIVGGAEGANAYTLSGK